LTQLIDQKEPITFGSRRFSATGPYFLDFSLYSPSIQMAEDCKSNREQSRGHLQKKHDLLENQGTYEYPGKSHRHMVRFPGKK
jgi:hypothetical protein